MVQRTPMGICFAVALAWCARAQAAFIPVTLVPEPDILSGFIDVTYDAATDAFLARGFSQSYNPGGEGQDTNIVGSQLFEIRATIDESGTLLPGGTLVIEGSVLGSGPSLLTADLTDFGFADNGGEILEFLMEITGGELEADYGGVGAVAGVIMDMGGNGYVDFTQSFDNLIGGQAGTGAGISDTAPIPGPSALAVLLAGCAFASRRRRRMR